MKLRRGAARPAMLNRALGGRLEVVRPVAVFACGAAGGAALGAGLFFGVGGVWGLAGSATVLACAAAVGYRARPVFLVEIEEPPPVDASPLIPPPVPIEPLDMVELPGGPFLMGSSDSEGTAFDDEKPQHRVTVSPFAMAKLVVTRKLYRDLMGKEPKPWREDRKERKSDNDLPANHVSWFDAVDFCIELSKRVGLAPPYRRQGDQVEWDRNAGGYRLPTEAEWEYAARAGTTTRWWWGDKERTGGHAWFSANSGEQVQQVFADESAKINRFGLHGMAGNVFQWCWDWFGMKYYGTSPPEDPAGPEVGIGRVLRGGSAWDVPRLLRSAYRLRRVPVRSKLDVGFRCVRAPRRRP